MNKTLAAALKMETDNTSTVDQFNSTQPTALEETLRHIETFSLVMYCVIIVVGSVGNGLVIYVTGFKMKRTVNSVWFLNLAIADFLFTTFLIFTAISYSQHHWPFGQFMCKLNSFVTVVNMFASIFLLTAISLDRCLSIWVVVWAQNKRTVLKAQITCAVIWVIAGFCSSPYATFRTVAEGNGTNYCGYSFKNGDKTYWTLTIFRFVMGFLVPFLVILFSYLAIGVRTRRLQRTRTRRSHRIIFSIIFAFCICWLPFHVLMFIQQKDNPDLQNIVQIGGPLVLILAFMNSCLNPILYVFMCDEFQKKLQQSICLVLESALAEDALSFASSRSMSSWIPRKSSSSAPPTDVKDQGTSLISTKTKVVTKEEAQSTEEDTSK